MSIKRQLERIEKQSAFRMSPPVLFAHSQEEADRLSEYVGRDTVIFIEDVPEDDDTKPVEVRP